MKSKLLFALFAIVLFASCAKDEPLDAVVDATTDEAQDRIAALPDFIITVYGSNVTTTTNLCGPTLPNVGCNTPGHGFTATIVVANVGTADHPPGGTIRLTWVDLTTGSIQQQDAPNPGIPMGSTRRFSRPYFLGPCGCPPPYTPFTHSFMAGVNTDGAIQELNYANNRSPQFDTCDGC